MPWPRRRRGGIDAEPGPGRADREVLDLDLPWLSGLIRARRPRQLPVVLTRGKVRAVLSHMADVPRLVATLLYRAGLRLLEGCSLRVKDVDFATNQIFVRQGKGRKDRVTLLPGALKGPLASHLAHVKEQHHRDVAFGAGWVELPGPAAETQPSDSREWAWHWVFPATRSYLHTPSAHRRRHHIHETVIQEAVRRAVLAAGIPKRATCHTFRHSFATH